MLICFAAITQQAEGLWPKSTWPFETNVNEMICLLRNCHVPSWFSAFVILQCVVKAEIKSISVFTETDMLMYSASFSSSD